MTASDTMPKYSAKGIEGRMISTKEAAKKLNGISDRRVRTLCKEGRIKGAKFISGAWIVPDNPVVMAASRQRPGKIEVKEKSERRGKNG